MKRIKYALVLVIMFPCGYLPLSWSQTMGVWFGRILMRLNRKRNLIANRNIEACFPQLSKEERQRLVLKSAEETGKWLFESPYIWFRNPDFLKKKIHINNPEVLQTAFEKKKGVVVILPHLGNFESLNFYLPFHFPFAAMYKPGRSWWMEQMVVNGRERMGTSMFSVNSRGVRGALRHLKRGGVLVVLSDHLPTKNTGVFAPFFGIPAHTGKLTQSLAKCNHSEVLLATVLRLPGGKGFDATFYPVQGVDSDDPVAAATAVNKAIEGAVRLCPEQYQWFYKRFSRQPEGTPDFYGS